MVVCQAQDCQNLAVYKAEGRRVSACKEHRQEGMQLVSKKKECSAEGCTKIPHYGFKGGQKTHCRQHQEPGMKSLIKQLVCQEEGCEKGPGYGFPGGRRTHCSKHQKPGMQSLIKQLVCKQEGCKRGPSYGYDRFTHCGRHKLPDMKYLGKQCEKEGCGKQPHYGQPGGPRSHCRKHQLEGMVLLDRRPTCVHEGCDKGPHYGPPGGSGMFCGEHKLEGMERAGKQLCVVSGCNKRPSHKMGNGPKTHCCLHQLPGQTIGPQVKRPRLGDNTGTTVNITSTPKAPATSPVQIGQVGSTMGAVGSMQARASAVSSTCVPPVPGLLPIPGLVMPPAVPPVTTLGGVPVSNVIHQRLGISAPASTAPEPRGQGAPWHGVAGGGVMQQPPVGMTGAEGAGLMPSLASMGGSMWMPYQLNQLHGLAPPAPEDAASLSALPGFAGQWQMGQQAIPPAAFPGLLLPGKLDGDLPGPIWGAEGQGGQGQGPSHSQGQPLSGPLPKGKKPEVPEAALEALMLLRGSTRGGLKCREGER
ncbi:unnamed protein product [Chrysoparadoxa australica]